MSKKSHKITAIVTTFNEEKNIAKCLSSISWADEILVVDSYSTDNTIAICEKFGAKILYREYKYGADQKNWAIQQAAYPWIVLLDADEVFETEIENEVKNILQSKPKYSAYWIYRKNYFLGKKIHFCGWQNDRVIRFFKRDFHTYIDKMVHEEIQQNTKTGKLRSKIYHYTANNFEEYCKRIERYAGYSAEEHIKSNKRITWFHLYIKPAYKFFYSYFIRGGFLDGRLGWIICKLRAKETWLKARKTIQHKNYSWKTK